MKKLLLIFMALFIIVLSKNVVVSSECEKQNNVIINGLVNYIEHPIYVEDEIMQVPLKDICKVLGISVYQDNPIYKIVKDESELFLVHTDGINVSTTNPDYFRLNMIKDLENPSIPLDMAKNIFGRLGYLIDANYETLVVEIKDLNPISICINGKEIYYDTQLIYYNNEIYLPMRAIFEGLGADVRWIDNYAVASLGEKIYKFNNYGYIYANNEEIFKYASVYNIKNRTLISKEILTNIINCVIKWDEDLNKVDIYTE